VRNPLVMVGAVVLAVVFALVGVWYQINPHHHVISYHALAFWCLAVVALIGASFARPERA